MRSAFLNGRAGWGLVVVGSMSVAAALAIASYVPAEGAPRALEPSEALQLAKEREKPRSLFTGAISSVDGSPIERAKIVVEHAALGQRFAGQTDASGRFSMDVPEGSVRITIEHPTHATHRSEAVLTVPVFRSYALSAPSSLIGRLLVPEMKDGRNGLRGKVRLVSADGSVAASAESKEDGTFELSDITPGTYTILAWMNGLAASTTTSVAGGLEHRVEIGLEVTRARAIRTGGAAVTLEVQDGPWRSRTGEPAFSQDKGRAIFDLPEGVAAYARLSAPGRATTLRSLPDTSAPELVPGGTLRGRVVDAAGAGLSGIPVALTWLDAKRGAPVLEHETATDGQGEYVLDGLAPGSHELRIKHPRFGTLVENIAIAQGASENYESKLEPKEYWVGRMVDSAGLPQAGEPIAFATADFGLASGVTDAEGAFRLGPLFPSKGVLIGLESYDVQANEYVAPGLATITEPFVFRVPGKSAQVTIRVSDAEGTALEGVEVRVRSPRFGGDRDTFPLYLEPWGRSDGSGAVTLRAVAAAEQDLWLSKPGFVPQRVDLDFSSKGPTMMAILERGGGFVLETQPLPAPSAGTRGKASCRFVVSREGPSASPIIERSQPCTSLLSAEDLVPGRYMVRVFSGRSMISTSVEVKANRRQSVTGSWSSAQALSGSLLSSTGKPCAGCLLRDDTRGVYTIADAQGGFNIFGYACGEPVELGLSEAGDEGEKRVQLTLACDDAQSPKSTELTL